MHKKNMYMVHGVEKFMGLNFLSLCLIFPAVHFDPLCPPLIVQQQMNEMDGRRWGRIRGREGVRVMKKKCWLKGSAKVVAILLLCRNGRERKGRGKEISDSGNE